MKRIIENSICLLLFATGVWQCTPSEYNLVDYKEIKYIRDQMRYEEHVHYYYIDGTLNAKTDIRWNMCNSIPDSIYTEYGIRTYDDRIDTIETSWNYCYDTLDYATKTIKTYGIDGVIKKTVDYYMTDSGWVETGFTAYNASGQKTEIVGYGMYHYWYSYDSSGQYAGYRYRYYYELESYSLSIDTVIYSDDRLSAVRIVSRQNDGDSIPIVKREILYKLDKHGKILQEESIDYDTIGDVRLNYSNSYRYNRRGQLLTLTTKNDKVEFRYHRGLKTWELFYSDGKLKHVYRYKYDFRNRLLRERTLRQENCERSPNNLLSFLYLMSEDVDERRVWTYEKAK